MVEVAMVKGEAGTLGVEATAKEAVVMEEGEKREAVAMAKAEGETEGTEEAHPLQADRQAPKALQMDHPDRLHPTTEKKTSNSYPD